VAKKKNLSDVGRILSISELQEISKGKDPLRIMSQAIEQGIGIGSRLVNAYNSPGGLQSQGFNWRYGGTPENLNPMKGLSIEKGNAYYGSSSSYETANGTTYNPIVAPRNAGGAGRASSPYDGMMGGGNEGPGQGGGLMSQGPKPYGDIMPADQATRLWQAAVDEQLKNRGQVGQFWYNTIGTPLFNQYAQYPGFTSPTEEMVAKYALSTGGKIGNIWQGLYGTPITTETDPGATGDTNVTPPPASPAPGPSPSNLTIEGTDLSGITAAINKVRDDDIKRRAEEERMRLEEQKRQRLEARTAQANAARAALMPSIAGAANAQNQGGTSQFKIRPTQPIKRAPQFSTTSLNLN